MSNILTDIMGFFKRKKFLTRPEDNDVVVVGVHESPNMTGVASPVPIKDAKLCTIADLRDPCERANWPLKGIEAGVFLGKEIIPAEDPTQESSCYYAFRRLKSLNLNLTIVENGDFVEFDTTAEENQANNVGTGQGIFKDKTGEVLNFRSLTSSDDSISITQSEDGNEIDLTCASDSISCVDLLSVLGSSENFDQFKALLSKFCLESQVINPLPEEEEEGEGDEVIPPPEGEGEGQTEKTKKDKGETVDLEGDPLEEGE